jgi:hypothetical protein
MKWRRRVRRKRIASSKGVMEGKGAWWAVSRKIPQLMMRARRGMLDMLDRFDDAVYIHGRGERPEGKIQGRPERCFSSQGILY